MAHILGFGPFLSAALIDPHAADILQEAGRTLYAALVGEVRGKALVVDNRLGCLDAHEAPSARTEVGELAVGRRNGSHGTRGVVARHGNHRHIAHPCELLHLLGELPDDRCGRGHRPKLLAPHADACQQVVVKVVGHGVQYLRCRCHGVLAHRLSGEHIAQRVGDEEHLVGLPQGRVAVLSHLVELEQRVEIHELYARLGIDLLFGQGMCEIPFHRVRGVRVSVSQRVAQYLPIVSHNGKVASPCVYAYAPDGNLSLVRHLQALDDLVVERENIPIYMPVGLDERVVKSCQLLKVYPSVVQSSDDGSSTGGPEVHCEEEILAVHRCDSVRSWFLLFSVTLQN